MKYSIRRSAQFKKDVKQAQRGGKDMEKLLLVISKLTDGETLPKKYCDHPLKGGFKGKRDCHVEDDWLLIYAVEDNELILYRTGTHSQLFR
jgi:mRNA interferase YafQ